MLLVLLVEEHLQHFEPLPVAALHALVVISYLLEHALYYLIVAAGDVSAYYPGAEVVVLPVEEALVLGSEQPDDVHACKDDKEDGDDERGGVEDKWFHGFMFKMEVRLLDNLQIE